MKGHRKRSLHRGGRCECRPILRDLERRVTTLERQMRKVMADEQAQQQEIADALTKIGDDATSISSSVSELVQQLQTAIANGQQVDLSALVTQAQTIQSNLDALASSANAAANPAPAPTPAPSA